jgi:hypothetical protein
VPLKEDNFAKQKRALPKVRSLAESHRLEIETLCDGEERNFWIQTYAKARSHQTDQEALLKEIRKLELEIRVYNYNWSMKEFGAEKRKNKAQWENVMKCKDWLAEINKSISERNIREGKDPLFGQLQEFPLLKPILNRSDNWAKIMATPSILSALLDPFMKARRLQQYMEDHYNTKQVAKKKIEAEGKEPTPDMEIDGDAL